MMGSAVFNRRKGETKEGSQGWWRVCTFATTASYLIVIRNTAACTGSMQDVPGLFHPRSRDYAVPVPSHYMHRPWHHIVPLPLMPVVSSCPYFYTVPAILNSRI